MGLQSVQTWLRQLSTAQHRSIYNCIPLLKDNSGTNACISERSSHWHETSERRENIKCGLRTIASEPSIWNIILLPESNRGGGWPWARGCNTFWLRFHWQEGVPSLPHCLGNSHRGTSGQMQSTKHAVKHISSLKPMGAHLVNQQGRTPRWILEAEIHLTQDSSFWKEQSPSQQFMLRSDSIWEAVLGVRAINTQGISQDAKPLLLVCHNREEHEDRGGKALGCQ